MIQADKKTLEAIISIAPSSEFTLFMKLVDDSIESLHLANVTTMGELRSWNQGRLQELLEIRNLVDNVYAMLDQARNDSDKKYLKNPNI
jgi:dsRNA-specific ribonuclease